MYERDMLTNHPPCLVCLYRRRPPSHHQVNSDADCHVRSFHSGNHRHRELFIVPESRDTYRLLAGLARFIFVD